MFSRLNRTVWIVAFVACLSGSTSVHPQALNPPYLSEMPAPARVVAEIQGKDAEDTGDWSRSSTIWRGESDTAT
jgi:hypothetical protein